jgi:hypothetical protein
MRKYFALFILGILFPILGTAAVPPVSARSLWQPGMESMREMKERCSKLAFPELGKCFAEEAKKARANPDVLAFMELTENQGFMRDFRETGNVDVAYALFPFRANENQRIFLVNGQVEDQPVPIDVDDPKWIPWKTIEKNVEYQRLKKRYPEVTLFQGERSGTKFPKIRSLPRQGQRFIIPYLLNNQCRACSIVGQLNLSFDFDAQARLKGVEVLSVLAGLSAKIGRDK